jgi:hypothetical protein
MRQVPFYANRADDLSCRVASTKSILEYFSGQKYAWKEVDDIIGYRPNRPAWTVKLWAYLAAHGYDVRMVEAFDYERYAREGEAYLATFLKPDELAWQLKHTNILEIQPLLPAFLESVQPERRSPTLKDIDAMLQDGYLVTVQLNSNALNNKPGYVAHVVTVYDKDGADYIAHDPGLPPRPARHIEPGTMYEAMGGDNNTTEVTGVRKL